MRFIPFHVIHWSGAALAYIILIIHGVNYYNPSFWKWLLPALVLVVLDRLYWIILTDRFNVEVKSAAAYDDVSRVAIIETDKPKGFKFEAGQYVLLRMPWIGECSRLRLNGVIVQSNFLSSLSPLLLFLCCRLL